MIKMEEICLNKVAQISVGNANTRLKEKIYEDGIEIKFITPKSIKNNFIEDKEIEKMNLRREDIKIRTTQENDIIVKTTTPFDVVFIDKKHEGLLYNSFCINITVDSEIMDKFVLEPLMMRNKNNLYDGSQNKVISEAVANNITVRKVKKFDLASYVMSCLMPQNSIKQVSMFSEAISGINSR